MRPTPAQYLIPHPLWVDMRVLPAVRDLLVLHTETRSYDWPSAANTLRLNWDKPASEAVAVDEFGILRPSLDFQAHVDDPNMWTLETSSLACFPYYQGCVGARDSANDEIRRL